MTPSRTPAVARPAPTKLSPKLSPTLWPATALAIMAVSGVSAAQAEELGRVISSTPVMQQVAVPRQVCTQEQVVSEAPKSGAGAAIGALVGGIVGHSVGGGMGQVAATGVGILGGAIVGDHLEGSRNQARTVQRCTSQTFHENRIVAYNVVYEYGGKQFSVQMPHDPGPHVRLQITPVGGTAPQTPVAPAPPTYVPPTPTTYVPAAPAVVSTTTIIEQPVYVPQVMVAPVVYPAYVHARPYAYSHVPHVRPYHVSPPVALSVNLGYSNVRGYGGHGRHRHRH